MTEHRVAIGRTGKGIGFWALQASGWLFVLYLVYAQCLPAFDYNLGVKLGTQEPASQVTQVGVAYWWAFAFGDLVAYLPLLIVGLVGHLLNRSWGRIILSAALGITVYWPIVSLAAVHAARGAEGWNLAGEAPYWIVLPLIALWGLWGLWQLTQEVRSEERQRQERETAGAA